MLTEWGVTYTVIESSDPESKNAAEELIIEYNRLKADNAKLLAVAKAAKEWNDFWLKGDMPVDEFPLMSELSEALNNAKDILDSK